MSDPGILESALLVITLGYISFSCVRSYMITQDVIDLTAFQVPVDIAVVPFRLKLNACVNYELEK